MGSRGCARTRGPAPALGLKVWGLGFRVWDLGVRVHGLWFMI